MSRMGRIPVEIPDGVTIDIGADIVTVKGPKGTLTQAYKPCITISAEDGKITFEARNNAKEQRALHGTYRSLVNNMVRGVTQGFEKILEIHGIGYRGRIEGNKLILQVGKSHEPAFEIPEALNVEMGKNTIVTITGTDKQLVGQWAATVRSCCPPEPYLGKGIRYKDEYVRHKTGKKMAG